MTFRVWLHDVELYHWIKLTFIWCQLKLHAHAQFTISKDLFKQRRETTSYVRTKTKVVVHYHVTVNKVYNYYIVLAKSFKTTYSTHGRKKYDMFSNNLAFRTHIISYDINLPVLSHWSWKISSWTSRSCIIIIYSMSRASIETLKNYCNRDVLVNWSIRTTLAVTRCSLAIHSGANWCVLHKHIFFLHTVHS